MNSLVYVILHRSTSSNSDFSDDYNVSLTGGNELGSPDDLEEAAAPAFPSSTGQAGGTSRDFESAVTKSCTRCHWIDQQRCAMQLQD